MKTKTIPRKASVLRVDAERIYAVEKNVQKPLLNEISQEEATRAIQQLRVHQIELEIQNEQLRQMQIELDQERERYFFLYDLAPVGYCSLSRDGVIIEANLYSTNLLATTRHELTGKPLTQYIHPEDQDEYYLYAKNLFKNGGQQRCELRMTKTNGISFWAQLEGIPAQEADGTAVYRLLISDITQRMKSEQTQRMETIGLLAGGIAHDFNNMCAIILGHAEIAKEELEPGSPLLEELEGISQAATHSAQLTKQLLAFAQKQAVRRIPVRINESLTLIVGMLSKILGRNLELRYQPGAHTGSILIDPGQLNQIVSNLCINARDASEGRGVILIETGRSTVTGKEIDEPIETKPGEYNWISVRDYGCGMDDATKRKIFEPFYTTKEFGTSSGLGLSTVHGIVLQNKGFIKVETQLGEGSCFKVFFPEI